MDEKVLLSNLFELDMGKDKVEKTNVPSHVMEVLAERTSMNKKEIRHEILIREKILEWMLLQDIKETPQVERVIQQYYFDPESVLKQITQE